jgi:hypothetical protein
MRALVDIGEHLFQQPWFIEENRKQQRALVDIGKHLFSSQSSLSEREIWLCEASICFSSQSTSSSAVRIRRNENTTYENFLPGQQKKQHTTLSMEQMRMVGISSSLKYLASMT